MKQESSVDKMRTKWKKIVDLISLKQLSETMGLNYKEKALKIKKISKTKKIHKLADEIILIYDEYFFRAIPIKKVNPSNPMSDWIPVLSGIFILIFLVNKKTNNTNLTQTSVVGVRG